ncbi:MAG: hypothetical protein KAS32_21235 [Candidatus Peribacteraceae bacterium]|nr:hypothetical protein [Candidatus Peribacteraceae bacterium]
MITIRRGQSNFAVRYKEPNSTGDILLGASPTATGAVDIAQAKIDELEYKVPVLIKSPCTDCT